MATGDINDFKQRIRADLPSWFGNADTPILSALIAGLATVWSSVYGLFQFVQLQARIRTSTGGYLDIISADFFGNSLPRATGESDTAFRNRILATILSEKGTRAGLYYTLKTLTGRAPVIVEPMRPADTGGYATGGVGYGVGGAYGSVAVGAYQAFIKAFRPASTGLPYVSGYGLATYPGGSQGGPGGYGIPSQIEYGSMLAIQNGVTDAQIYAAIDSAKPAATIVWTEISN